MIHELCGCRRPATELPVTVEASWKSLWPAVAVMSFQAMMLSTQLNLQSSMTEIRAISQLDSFHEKLQWNGLICEEVCALAINHASLCHSLPLHWLWCLVLRLHLYSAWALLTYLAELQLPACNAYSDQWGIPITSVLSAPGWHFLPFSDGNWPDLPLCAILIHLVCCEEMAVAGKYLRTSTVSWPLLWPSVMREMEILWRNYSIH